MFPKSFNSEFQQRSVNYSTMRKKPTNNSAIMKVIRMKFNLAAIVDFKGYPTTFIIDNKYVEKLELVPRILNSRILVTSYV